MGLIIHWRFIYIVLNAYYVSLISEDKRVNNMRQKPPTFLELTFK